MYQNATQHPHKGMKLLSHRVHTNNHWTALLLFKYVSKPYTAPTQRNGIPFTQGQSLSQFNKSKDKSASTTMMGLYIDQPTYNTH